MNHTDPLKTLYASLRDNVEIASSLAEKMSPPLLVAPQSAWFESTERILVVGQETQGWKQEWAGVNSFSDFKNEPDSVDALQKAYIKFCFSETNSKHRNSPFWRTYREIRKTFDDDVYGIATNVLWTNLYRCSNNGKSWYERTDKGARLLVEQAFDGILLQEIEILAPTGIIFFTGPRYDGYLRSSLNAEFSASPVHESYTKRELAEICINTQPIPAYRTYHPNYMQRAKDRKYRSIIPIIIKALRKIKEKDGYE